MNLAEDNERIRRLRKRERERPDRPRAGSLRDAVQHLAGQGVSAGELRDMLARAELRLVMTAHPTEARRRTTVEKLARVFARLRDLDERAEVPGDEAAARMRMAATIQELWGSDEVRAATPTVHDEVHAGLVYFASTLHRVVPALYRELEAAVAEAYPGEEVAVPPLLTFGSWMGGDRDGNPNVSPAATREALAMMRNACLHFLEARADVLAQRVSLSDRLAPCTPELDELLSGLGERFPEAAERLARAQPRGALPARVRADRGAGAGDARGLGARVRRAVPSCSTTCAAPSGRCAPAARRSSPTATCATRSARSRCSASTSRGSTCASTRGGTARRWPRCSQRSACTRATRR